MTSHNTATGSDTAILSYKHLQKLNLAKNLYTVGFSFSLIFCLVSCGRLGWLSIGFEACVVIMYRTRRYQVSYQEEVPCIYVLFVLAVIHSRGRYNVITSASVELTQTRHSHSKQLFHGGQISVFLQGGSKSFIRCL